MTGDELRVLLAPLVEAAGFELYDVEDAGAVLRVLVDRAGGIDLDGVAVATRIVSDALDEHDVLSGPTTLEVSSPGLERPLRTTAHHRAALGSEVDVKTVAGTEGERRFRGTLVEADEESFTVEGTGGVRSFAYGEVERARTVFEWGGQPRPGGDKAKASATRHRGAARTKGGS